MKKLRKSKQKMAVFYLFYTAVTQRGSRDLGSVFILAQGPVHYHPDEYLFIYIPGFVLLEGVLFALARLRLDYLVVLRSILKDRTESRTTERSENRSRNISLIHNSCGWGWARRPGRGVSCKAVLGSATRLEAGDDKAQWDFVLGNVPLDGRITLLSPLQHYVGD